MVVVTNKGRWKSALIASVGIVLTFLITQGIMVTSARQQQQAADEQLQRTAWILQARLDADIKTIGRIAQRLSNGVMNTDGWLKDSELHRNDFPAYRGFAIADRGFRVVETDHSGIGRETWADLANLVRAFTGAPAGPFIVEPGSDQPLAVLVHPLTLANGSRGYLMCAYDLQMRLGNLPEVGRQVYFEITDGGNVIFSNIEGKGRRDLEKHSTLAVPGRQWNLRQVIDAGFDNGALVLLVLVSGISLSLMLARTMWLNEKIREQSAHLAASDERYSTALQASNIASWNWDVDTNSGMWGGSAWRIMGASSNEELNECKIAATDWVIDEDREKTLKAIDDALSQGKPYSLEFRVKTYDGRVIWVRSDGQAVTYRGDNPARVSGTLTDITERKEIENRARLYQARLEAILDNMVDGLITINESGIVQTYNKACERIFGYRADEVIGSNISLLMPHQHAIRHDQYLKNYQATGNAKIIGVGRELEGRRKDGSLFALDLSVAEVNTGGEKIFSGIVRDISDRKRAEFQLRRSHEELEKFAYIASHDLKAPLRNIDNLATWVLEDTADILPEDAKKKLHLLCERVGRLEMLLNDILAYSRAGRIVEDPIDLDMNEMVGQLIDIHVVKPFTGRIAGNLPALFSPSTPLAQVFGNLLTNAVKHHDGGSGVIEVEAVDRDDYVEFIVRDDGPGIPADYHDLVFQMFQTLQSRDRMSTSGLGLAIVKKLVDGQGGRVWIENNRNGRGTEFHFLWPRKAAS